MDCSRPPGEVVGLARKLSHPGVMPGWVLRLLLHTPAADGGGPKIVRGTGYRRLRTVGVEWQGFHTSKRHRPAADHRGVPGSRFFFDAPPAWR